MGIWLCSPLLSVIDTSFVGMLSGTVQQAALNPAVAVVDYTGRLMVSSEERGCLLKGHHSTNRVTKGPHMRGYEA